MKNTHYLLLPLFCLICMSAKAQSESVDCPAIYEQKNYNNDSEILIKPEGGFIAYYEKWKSTYTYSLDAISKQAEGRIFVEFIVLPDGQAVCPRIYRGLHQSLDQEAIDFFENNPDWTLTDTKGVDGNTRMVIPFIFDLKAYQDRVAVGER